MKEKAPQVEMQRNARTGEGNGSRDKYYVVLYAGDVATRTKDMWQIWTGAELDAHGHDQRILEVYESNTPHAARATPQGAHETPTLAQQIAGAVVMASYKRAQPLTCGDIENIASFKLEPLLSERDALRAQRDELLSASKGVIQWVENPLAFNALVAQSLLRKAIANAERTEVSAQ